MNNVVNMQAYRDKPERRRRQNADPLFIEGLHIRDPIVSQAVLRLQHSVYVDDKQAAIDAKNSLEIVTGAVTDQLVTAPAQDKTQPEQTPPQVPVVLTAEEVVQHAVIDLEEVRRRVDASHLDNEQTLRAQQRQHSSAQVISLAERRASAAEQDRERARLTDNDDELNKWFDQAGWGNDTNPGDMDIQEARHAA